jgi:hypothetical protein
MSNQEPEYQELLVQILPRHGIAMRRNDWKSIDRESLVPGYRLSGRRGETWRRREALARTVYSKWENGTTVFTTGRTIWIKRM